MGPFRDKDKDVIKSGALGVTWISGALGALTVITTVFNERLIDIFGENLDADLKAGILAVVILAWTLIAVADVTARARVTAARLQKPADEVVTAPQGMKVKLIEAEGVDASSWQVSAIRGTELLIAKSDKKPKWVTQDEVVLDG